MINREFPFNQPIHPEDNQSINKAFDRNYGNRIKSGDTTPLKYTIKDGDGEPLDKERLLAMDVTAILKYEDIVAYETEAIVTLEDETENYVGDLVARFTIQEALAPSATPYILEFHFENGESSDRFIFPSANNLDVYITPSALNSDDKAIEKSSEQRLKEIVESSQTLTDVKTQEGERIANEEARQAKYIELVDTGIMQENINQKLSESEQTYAPRLTNLEQNDADLTAQLAQTATSKVDKDGSGQVKWSNLAQDARENISGGKVAVVEDNSVITANLTDNVIKTSKIGKNEVTAETTNFINTSTNLLNRDDVVYGKFIQADGTIITSDTYHYSHKIDVLPGQTLFTRNIITLAFYNQFGEFVSRPDIRDSLTVVPDQAYYGRVNIQKIRYDKPEAYDLQISISTTEMPYEPFYAHLKEEYFNPESINAEMLLKKGDIKPDMLGFLEMSSNLYNKKTTTLNKFVDVSGVEQDSTKTALGDYIKITPSTVYSTGETPLTTVYYDADKKFISRPDKSTGVTTFTTPANAHYVRLQMLNIYADSVQLNLGSTLLPYEEWYRWFNDELVPPKQADTGGEVISPVAKKNVVFDTSIEGTFNTNEVFNDFTDFKNSTALEFYALWDELTVNHPNVFERVLTRYDGLGNPMHLYSFMVERPSASLDVKIPTVFINTAIHGAEKAGALVTYLLIKQMLENWENDILLEGLHYNVNYLINPIANPSGWNAFTRKNHNGVDINRNFPTGHVVGSDPTSPTYGGTAPFSELESQFIKEIYDTFPDIDIMLDFHNFFESSSGEHFLWIPTPQEHTQRMAQALFAKMGRKWSKDFSFVPDGYFAGYTNVGADGTAAGYFRDDMGIERTVTFEICNRFVLDTSGTYYDQNVCKAGVEGLANWLLINLRDMA